MRPLFAGLTAAIVLLSTPSVVAQPSSLDATLEEIDAIMLDWAEHRAQTITVKSISGLEVAATASTAEQLELRLKSLLTKKRSNREWKGYWEGEARIAKRLLEAYDKLAPKDGKGLLASEVDARTEARHQAAERAVAAKLRVDTILDRADGARAQLLALLEKEESDIAGFESAIDAAKATRDEALADQARTEQSGGDAAALAASRQAAERAQKALDAQRELLTETEARIAYLKPLTSGGKLPDMAPPIAGKMAAQVRVLQEAATKVAAARQALADAEEESGKAAARLAQVVTLQDAIRDRSRSLTAWEELARAKTVNQDVFLEAINADIAAVEERLRGVQARPPNKHVGASAAACEAERKRDMTPFEKYQACERTTKDELRELQGMVEDTQAAALLNDRQTTALTTLVDAQTKDLELVVREFRVANAERKRAEEASETEAWREAWQTYATRAKEKQKALADALRSSKDTQRALTVNKAFLKSERESLEGRIAGFEVALEERTSFGRLSESLLGTAWHFLKNAYMVPIYILIAWLVLLATRRITRRVVKVAQEEGDDRDEVQRVETLAAVTRGAIRLVVYIATALLCLEAVGVDTGPILGGAAIFGLAISFGSQSLVKDFVTGFFILLENQYAVGDFVEINGKSGTVEKITMRRTVLRDSTGQVINVPNGAISNVGNMTQGWSRVVSHIGVAYGTDLNRVEQVVNKLGDEMFAEAHWQERLEEPPRYVGLTKFADSAITVRVMFKTKIFEQWAAERAFNRRIKDAFEAEGIEMPFPQRDVHILSSALDAKAPAVS